MGGDTQKCLLGSNVSRSPALKPSSMCWACNDTVHYSTFLIAKRAVEVIQNHTVSGAEKPFFMYLPFQDTHGPGEAPRVYRDAYSTSRIPDPVRRNLAGKLSVVDEALKNVTDALAANGMLQNTVIIYTADNGGPIATSVVAAKGASMEDGIGASNWPLRGGKHNAYEGGVRAHGT